MTRQFTDDLAETEHRLKIATYQLDRLKEWAQKLSDRAMCTVIAGGHGGLSPAAHCHSDDLIGLRAVLAHIADKPEPDRDAATCPQCGQQFLAKAHDQRDKLLKLLVEAKGELLHLSQNAPHVQNKVREEAFAMMDRIRRTITDLDLDEANSSDMSPHNCPHCGEYHVDKLVWGEGKEGEVHCHSCGRYYVPDRSLAAEQDAPTRDQIDQWASGKSPTDLRRRLAVLIRAVDIQIKTDAFAGGPNRPERESAAHGLRAAFKEAKRGGV